MSVLFISLIGTVSAIAGAYFSAAQQYSDQQKIRDCEALQQAFSLTHQLANETMILIKSKKELLLHLDDYENRGQPYCEFDTIDLIPEIGLDIKRRPLNECYDQVDVKKAADIMLICELHTDDQTLKIAHDVYQLLFENDVFVKHAWISDAYPSVYERLLEINDRLSTLKKRIRLLLDEKKESPFYKCLRLAGWS